MSGKTIIYVYCERFLIPDKVRVQNICRAKRKGKLQQGIKESNVASLTFPA